MTQDNSFLATEPIGRLLRRLALPTIAAQVINMLYNIVDRIYIGHIPGDGALALTGVGVCLPVLMVVSAFASLVGSGGAPRASIAMGRGDNDTAQRILGNCFILQIAISAVLTAVLLIFNRSLLLAFGASENTIDYAAGYMGVYAIGTIFVQITLGMNSFITAQGYTSMAMRTVLIGAVLNIILDPVFIFALDLGVEGAALATIISQAVSCIWVILFLCGKKSVLRLERRWMHPDGRLMLSCVSLGAATFIMSASESVISVCFNSSLLKYGGDLAVGTMTILTSVMQFALMPLQGLGQGAQPIISYNYGAWNAPRVKKTFRLLLTCDLGYSTLLWVLVMLFPRQFAGIFTADAELIAFTANALRIYAAVLCIFGIQMACQVAFVSVGNAKCSILVAVMRKFILLLPMIYIMPALFANKTAAVYAAEPVADVLAITFTSILFSFQFKKAMREIEN